MGTLRTPTVAHGKEAQIWGGKSQFWGACTTPHPHTPPPGYGTSLRCRGGRAQFWVDFMGFWCVCVCDCSEGNAQ